MPRNWQFLTDTFRTPPDISLPTVTPPCPVPDLIRRTMMFSLGPFGYFLASAGHNQASSFSPDLMAMTSSLVLK